MLLKITIMIVGKIARIFFYSSHKIFLYNNFLNDNKKNKNLLK